MAVTRRLTSRTIATAVDALRVADPKMARAIDAVGPCTMLPRTDGTHFDHLARAIVYQPSRDKYMYAFGDQVGLPEDGQPQDPDGPDDNYIPPEDDDRDEDREGRVHSGSRCSLWCGSAR